MTSNRKKLLSVKEIAEWFGVNPITIYRKVQGGEMPAVKFGKNWLFQEDIINEWLREKSSASSSERYKTKRNVEREKKFEAPPHVLLVYLFGSVSEGYSGPMSDLDIAYLDDGTVAPFDLEPDLENCIRKIFPDAGRIDLAQLNAAPDSIKYKVIKCGRLIYARSDETRATFEEEAIFHYLDYEPVLKRFYREAA